MSLDKELGTKAEACHRAFLENCSDTIIIDKDAVVRYISPTVEERYGYQPKELVGKSAYQLLHLDDLQRAMELGEKAGGMTGSVKHGEFKALQKDGTWRTVEASSINMLDHPEIRGTVVFTRDLTDRKRLEGEVKEEKERFRILVGSMSEVFLITDRGGNAIFAGDSVKSVLGFSQEEMKRINVYSLIHPEDFSEIAKTVKETLRSPGARTSYQCRIKHKEGTWRYVEVASENHFDNPAIGDNISIARDVTEKIISERRVERLNRCFLNLGPDTPENLEMIIDTARELLEAKEAQYCKPAKDKIVTISTAAGQGDTSPPGGFKNHVCRRVIQREEDEPLIMYSREDELGENYADFNMSIYRAYIGCPVKVGGRNIGCLAVLDDRARPFSKDDCEILGTLAQAISKEEERLLNEVAMRDFLNVASHELRHPITVIQGFAVTLKEQWQRIDDEKKKEFLGIIEESSRRMARLVTSLFDAATIEKGHFSLDKKSFSLKRLLEVTISDTKNKGVSNEISLRVPEDLVPVKIDWDKMALVIINLISNASTYSAPDSKIEIEVEKASDHLLVSVLDRGKGIPEDEREAVFERFYQVEDADHHSSPGMGLGLYSAKEVVKSHGGRIWHEPREGGGSEFKFTLPAG